MKLSIIICVYNTDYKYFEKCLKSITNSTLYHDDYEILVIDDGSDKDYSKSKEAYPIRIIKTENQGILKARLLGIKEARGEYIAFVDSDDTVTFNYHRPMLEFAIKNNADIVFNDWAFHTDRTRYCCLSDSTVSGDFVYENDDILLAFAKNEGREHSFFVLWNKIFRAAVLRASIDVLEKIAADHGRYNYSEDVLISFFAFKNSKKCANIHTGYYFYRIHSEQNVNVINEERFISHVTYMSNTLDIMTNSVDDSIYKEEIKESFKKWTYLMSRTHYSYAKANKYYHLYDFIKDKYHVSKLKPSKLSDSKAYSKNKVLPKNIEIIDKELLEVWKSDTDLNFKNKPTYLYINRSLEYMIQSGKNITFSKNGITITTPKIKIKDRILMNKFVYTVGLILFKKGSKARAFLKKHI